MTIFPDFTALLISGIVVLLALALKNWFFEPLARTMEERESRYGRSRTELQEKQGRLAAAKTRLETALVETRQAGYAEMDRIRREAAAAADQRLSEARDRARRILADGLEALEKDTAAAEAELETAAGELAADLTARLLRRAS